MLAEERDSAKSIMDQAVALIDKCLNETVRDSQLHPSLTTILRYALFPGGKRIRPLFFLMLFHDCGGEFEKVGSVAAAIELIHSSTLIHDDLPALDDDDMRRGRPSVHCAFGEARAVLAGDVLIPLAFSAVGKLLLPEKTVARLTGRLSEAYLNVCHGQYLDILPRESNANTEPTDLLILHDLKTGSLFRVAAEFAAIAADMDDFHVSLFGTLGSRVGVYFQVVDDLIDAFGTDQMRGREGSSDKRHNKQTFFSNSHSADNHDITTVGLGALQRSRDLLENTFENLESKLERNLEWSREIVSSVDSVRDRILEMNGWELAP